MTGGEVRFSVRMLIVLFFKLMKNQIVMMTLPLWGVLPVCAQKKDSLMGMRRDSVMLTEVVVSGDHTRRDVQMKSSLNLVRLDQSYLRTNFSGSLMQSLAAIPGVKSMDIGSGQSKPAIRGLGFNRMVVTLNGIKHEGQQWGDDHGLEINQFSIDKIDIIKGPAALLYGSDAIGGVINLYSDEMPLHPVEGSIDVFARTNNESVGAAATVKGRKGAFFYKSNLTGLDYADYKIPTDRVQYNTYLIPLKDKRLRNTAGHEYDGDLLLGYEKDRFKTYLSLSDSYAKSGFFANAHGFDFVATDPSYDVSRRDIGLPYQSVNHLTAISHSSLRVANVGFTADFAWQKNLRKEMGPRYSHGYMPEPPDNEERRFDKSTYTANIAMKMELAEKHTLNAGFNGEYQRNRRGGWGFIIPDFETASTGVYLFDRYHLNDDFILSAGIRYDRTHMHLHSYNDWYRSPVSQGATDSVYIQRTADMKRNFNSFTWSIGANYNTGNWLLKMNIGKSFRVPIAKELGTNGINYNIFRYEEGNPNLKPEEAYQVDAGINWHNRVLNVQVDPYLNYFTNYIYLNPTPEFHDPDGMQLSRYTEARVLRYGLEIEAAYRFLTHWELHATGEYLYARQLDGPKKSFTLPFTPPASGALELKYTFTGDEPGNEGFVSTGLQAAAEQGRIVPPESVTPGYCIWNMTAGKSFSWRKYKLRVSLQAHNLLNKRYYDHTSYYRLIDIPEPGRNFALMLGMNF